MFSLNGSRTVDHQQISFLNSITRRALRQGDSKAIFVAILNLCKQDQQMAIQLSQWFLNVGNTCRAKQGNITEDQILMRMWMLGNVDISAVLKDAAPVFVLTSKGLENVGRSPKERWWYTLLWDCDEMVRNEECVIS